ncbi:1,4-alpha-glucan branching protein GlgB [Pigmentiphaga sp. H8]|uniref:1,4-alpha-glucan branching protein GlgB n=1 Tax=Pigmentiphaga sp. H8 TaxID=2488560 RepID=UPI000F5A7E28|nr:1,4-alpha-glucan branching protein GlgB [Pigmentiphaga sp. H8]AZG08122.1 1,4-alpha-glucan branching protein GlgB [Pigmentiphaga sp. H8]
MTDNSRDGGIAPADIDALVAGRHADPFSVLGPQLRDGRLWLRAFLPGAVTVQAVSDTGGVVDLRPLRAGVFEARADPGFLSARAGYRLRIQWPDAFQEVEDPYAFGLVLGDEDLALLARGDHDGLAACLGAHCTTMDGIPGVRFAVWAPNAQRVSVVGGFNAWDGRRHPMRLRHSAGVWELFVPRLSHGEPYKYELLGPDGGLLPQKADPCAFQAEPAPGTASVVADPEPYAWTDEAWMAGRAARHATDAPISIYEVHAGSWLGKEDGGTWTWHELADRLIPYVAGMGFTHLELLPIMEYPFGGSWGYQPLGMFAPTARHGSPRDFAAFVDRCHAAGLGVILDWVPAHFPTDPHGLARFDGTALYEYQDPREGFHQDWNTYIYNLGRNEVCNFMRASALHWLGRYHVDGLRVDAVASMLYRDYSRRAGEWVPNSHGGRENLEAIAFLRDLNGRVRRLFPDAMMIAEESTAWPGVTAPPEAGGLGFHYKWNMGWMHDTLRYMQRDPVHRHYHHHDLTFGMVYAYSEQFVLPLSHDEVVHGKGSLIGKMPGDRWQRFANLRAYFGFMWSHPGRKLLFMGGELAQEREWNHDAQLAWDALADPLHAGVQRLVADLNRTYAGTPALHRRDGEPAGFRWVIGDDDRNSVFAYLRLDGDRCVLAVCNMTPVPRGDYRLGVPRGGRWREIVNTDAADYGGSGVGNAGAVEARPQAAHGLAHSLVLTLPPLATLLLEAE